MRHENYCDRGEGRVLYCSKVFFILNSFNYSGALEAFLCTLLEVIKKSFQFVKEYQDRKPSYTALLTQNEASIAKENDVLDQFVESLWKVIDQTCVPALMVNCEALENQAVFKNFFEILHFSVSSLSTCRHVFAQKLASGSFVRLSLEIKEKFGRRAESKELGDVIANFLTELCLALGDATDSIQLGELLKTSNIGGIHSSTTCLNLLTQSSVSQGTNEIIDDSLFSTQCACIELMYVSFAHGDEIVPVEHLMTSLHKYLVLHPDLSILPRVSLKHLLFLWMGSYRRLRTLALPSTVIESRKDSQEILEQSLVKFKADEFESIYIHDALFVSWIFSSESLAQAFGQQVLICFLETEKAQDSSSNAELYQLLATNSQSFRTFVSLVDCNEEAIANRVVTILEALIGADSDTSAKLNTSNQSSLAIHITSIFHKLFLSHKANPLQEHSITAMLNVMTAVQMKNLAFDIKLLYHVINLLTSTKCCQTFTVVAFNYLNVSLAWDTNRENQRVATVLLSNKGFCSYVQEILNAKLAKDVGERRDSVEDVNLLASILVLISSLANSQNPAHKDVQEAFRIDKKCMIKLANERQNILGLSSLVFWDAFFRTTGVSENLVVVLTDATQGKEQPLKKLSEVDLHVLLVYLQNSLIHDSETVRQCAVKCLDSFLSYVPNASYFATNPWNKIVLESQLCVLSVNVVTSSFVLFCFLILQHAANKHQLTSVLQNAVKAILEKIPSIPCSEQELSWQCISLLVQVLSGSEDIMSSNQKGAVVTWLRTFKESLRTNVEESDSINESKQSDLNKDMKFYKLDAVIFAKSLLKPQVAKGSDLLEKAFLLVDDESDEDAETANQSLAMKKRKCQGARATRDNT